MLQSIDGLAVTVERMKCVTQSDGKKAIMICAHNRCTVRGRQNSGSKRPKKELEQFYLWKTSKLILLGHCNVQRGTACTIFNQKVRI